MIIFVRVTCLRPQRAARRSSTAATPSHQYEYFDTKDISLSVLFLPICQQNKIRRCALARAFHTADGRSYTPARLIGHYRASRTSSCAPPVTPMPFHGMSQSIFSFTRRGDDRPLKEARNAMRAPHMKFRHYRHDIASFLLFTHFIVTYIFTADFFTRLILDLRYDMLDCRF